MSGSQDHLSTQEFSKKAGVSTSTVSKWLRTNKISGQKMNGKWMISPAELSKVTASKTGGAKKTPPAPSTTASPSRKTARNTKDLTIEEFSAMTYLTEYGVKKWLKEGRLVGAADKSGQSRVAASNLDQPHLKKLIR